MKLSKAQKPSFDYELRLIDLCYEDHWHFYITNLFQTTCIGRGGPWKFSSNEIKNIHHLEHPISRNKTGIMVEIYSALIFHLLTRIAIALAAQKTDQPVEAFSFSRSFDLLKAFLSTHLGEILGATQMTLICFLQHLVEAVTRMGLKDRSAHIL